MVTQQSATYPARHLRVADRFFSGRARSRSRRYHAFLEDLASLPAPLFDCLHDPNADGPASQKLARFAAALPMAPALGAIIDRRDMDHLADLLGQDALMAALRSLDKPVTAPQIDLDALLDVLERKIERLSDQWEALLPEHMRSQAPRDGANTADLAAEDLAALNSALTCLCEHP